MYISTEDNVGKRTHLVWAGRHRGLDIYEVNSNDWNEYRFEIDAEEFEGEAFTSVEEAKTRLDNHAEAQIT